MIEIKNDSSKNDGTREGMLSMYRFYVENENIKEDEIIITGSDVNHIKNVLRMRVGEKLIICNGQGKDFYCIIADMSSDGVRVQIEKEEETATELKTKLYLFQGLPKKDKMELIIQKAVELGVHEIIPVITKRTIVKIEDKKKEQKKMERWETISLSAAKQSMRGLIPTIKEPMSYKEALKYAKNLDAAIIPFEHAEGMNATKSLIKDMKGKKSIGIFIGPEGGYEDDEITTAISEGVTPITLGKRILRTETAGLAILSVLMFELEED